MIERFGQFRRHVLQAIGAGVHIEDVDFLGVHEPHGGPQRSPRNIARGP
ncbi:MAG: hypothetical protein ACKO6B_04275 [Planctomycetia bacterium]